MRVPTIRGVIDRRILVNYRVDPEVCARVVPAPFRVRIVNGHAIAGICLIRLTRVRPAFVPIGVGMRSENAAHRIAVEWDEGGDRREGVFVPRRDTSSRLSTFVGGRVFPGEHHHARFEVEETADRVRIAFASDDGTASVRVSARTVGEFPGGSVFGSLEDASRFFEAGSVGYSATRDAGRFDGVELRCDTWSVHPLEVEEARSSYFDDIARFPPGSAVVDCALLMRGIGHEWHARDEMCACSQEVHP